MSASERCQIQIQSDDPLCKPLSNEQRSERSTGTCKQGSKNAAIKSHSTLTAIKRPGGFTSRAKLGSYVVNGSTVLKR